MSSSVERKEGAIKRVCLRCCRGDCTLDFPYSKVCAFLNSQAECPKYREATPERYTCEDCGKQWESYTVPKGKWVGSGIYILLCKECAKADDQKCGRKDDSGKSRMELLPLDVLEEVAKVLTYGAKKYAPDNWKKVPDAKDRYTGALLRHLTAWRKGEVFDKEIDGEDIRHIVQVACNALFLVWLELSEAKL